MDVQKLRKWGFGLWIGYEILKEINSNSQPDTNSVGSVNYVPSGLDEYNTIHHSSIAADISRSFEESLSAAFNTVFKKPTLLESPIRLPPDPQTISASTDKWKK